MRDPDRREHLPAVGHFEARPTGVGCEDENEEKEMKELGDVVFFVLATLGGLSLVLMLFAIAFLILNMAFDEKLSAFILDSLKNKEKK